VKRVRRSTGVRRTTRGRRDTGVRRRAGIVLLVLAILTTAGVALAADPPTIARYIIAGGGDQVSSGNFTIRSTVGQPVTGRATTGDTELCAGFWCTGIRYETFLPLVIRN